MNFRKFEKHVHIKFIITSIVFNTGTNDRLIDGDDIDVLLTTHLLDIIRILVTPPKLYLDILLF